MSRKVKKNNWYKLGKLRYIQKTLVGSQEENRQRAIEFPRILFATDYSGLQFGKWAAYAVNNYFRVGVGG